MTDLGSYILEVHKSVIPMNYRFSGVGFCRFLEVQQSVTPIDCENQNYTHVGCK